MATDRVYRAEMGLPPMDLEKVPDEEDKSSVAPKVAIPKSPAPRMPRSPAPRSPTTGKRMDIPLNPDQSADLKPGQEVGVSQEKRQAYKKQFAKGGYTKAADGIAKRGKTRGRML